MMIQTCQTLAESKSTLEVIMPTLITGIIAIVIFVVGKIIDHNYKIQEFKRSWYLKIIIDPNISKLDSFIDKIDKHYISSLSLIHNILVKNSSEQDLLLHKAILFGQYDEIIRDLEIELFTVVGVNHPELQIELTTKLQEFEFFKTSLDSPDLKNSAEEKFDFKAKLFTLKADLLEILYKPIRFEKNKSTQNLDGF
jgi:hypothetical protein